MSTYGYSVRPAATHAPGLFGRVMGLVAVTVGFATLGVYIARGWGGAGWFISWLLAIGCLIGLNAVNARGNTSLALVLLFAFGLLIGISVSVTPGGAGVTQALNVVVLESITTKSNATAYSVSQQLIITAWDIVFAVIMVTWVFGWSGGKDLVKRSYVAAEEKRDELKKQHAARSAAT